MIALKLWLSCGTISTFYPLTQKLLDRCSPNFYTMRLRFVLLTDTWCVKRCIIIIIIIATINVQHYKVILLLFWNARPKSRGVQFRHMQKAFKINPLPQRHLLGYQKIYVSFIITMLKTWGEDQSSSCWDIQWNANFCRFIQKGAVVTLVISVLLDRSSSNLHRMQ